MATVISVLAIFTYATWLFLHDNSDFTATRERQLAHLTQEKSALLAQRKALASDISGVRHELEAQQLRVDRSLSVIVSLTPLLSRWERWFGDRVEQENLEKRISQMQEVEAAARARVLVLQSTATSKDWSLSGLDTQIAETNAEIVAVSRDSFLDLALPDFCLVQFAVVFTGRSDRLFCGGSVAPRGFFYFYFAASFPREIAALQRASLGRLGNRGESSED